MSAVHIPAEGKRATNALIFRNMLEAVLMDAVKAYDDNEPTINAAVLQSMARLIAADVSTRYLALMGEDYGADLKFDLIRITDPTTYRCSAGNVYTAIIMKGIDPLPGSPEIYGMNEWRGKYGTYYKTGEYRPFATVDHQLQEVTFQREAEG